jgi:hypothetical protein
MYKTKRQGAVSGRLTTEYIKQKYMRGQRQQHRFDVLAYSEGLTDYANTMYYGLATIGTPAQVCDELYQFVTIFLHIYS